MNQVSILSGHNHFPVEFHGWYYFIVLKKYIHEKRTPKLIVFISQQTRYIIALI